jgi:signal peptidase I
MVLGESDLPTFMSGDKVIINRSAYDITIPFTNTKIVPWRGPSRGDMILCHLHKKANGEFWLKRIIGIPGDTVQIKDNRVFINHTPLKYEVIRLDDLHPEIAEALGDIVAMESGFGMEQTVTYSDTKNIISNLGPLIVPDGHYFVLGDNRLNSLDSRFLGQVPRHEVYGKYLFRIYRKEKS